MNLTEAIKTHINTQVDQMLSEIDLDSVVDQYLSPENMEILVRDTLNSQIKSQVMQKIRERIYEAIHSRVPLIDAVIESKVVAFMMGFTAYIDQLENDVNNNAEGKKQ